MANIQPYAPEREPLKRVGAQVQYANYRDEALGRGILEYWIQWRVNYTDIDVPVGGNTTEVHCVGIPKNSRILDVFVDLITPLEAAGATEAIENVTITDDLVPTETVVFTGTDNDIVNTAGFFLSSADATTPAGFPVKYATPTKITVDVTGLQDIPWDAGLFYVGCKVIGYHDE